MTETGFLVVAGMILAANFFLLVMRAPEIRRMIDPKTRARFGVRMWGRGKDVILIHGGWLAGFANKVLRIAFTLLRLALPEKRIILVEPPGVGATSWYTSFMGPWWKRGRRKQVIAENFAFFADAELRALKNIGVERIWFVGFSMGANIVAKLALRAPVHGIEVMSVISNSGTLRRYGSSKELQRAFSVKKSWAEHQAIRKESENAEVRWATESRLKLSWEFFRDVLGRCFILRRSKMLMMLTYGQMLSETQLREDLRRLSRKGVPVHFIVGSKDDLSDRDTHMSVWRSLNQEKNNPHSARMGLLGITLVPEGTHMGVTSDPSIYVPLILEAIQENTH